MSVWLRWIVVFMQRKQIRLPMCEYARPNNISSITIVSRDRQPYFATRQLAEASIALLRERAIKRQVLICAAFARRRAGTSPAPMYGVGRCDARRSAAFARRRAGTSPAPMYGVGRCDARRSAAFARRRAGTSPAP